MSTPTNWVALPGSERDPLPGARVRQAADPAEHILVTVIVAVAPLWAGLVALMNENLGEPVGFLHPYLYKKPAAATFRDITEGGNDVSGLGVSAAGPGWDPCTGMGTPDGRRLLSAVSGELTRQGVIANLHGLVGVAGYVTGDG